MDTKGTHWHIYEIFGDKFEILSSVYATWHEAGARAKSESRKSKNTYGVIECDAPSTCFGIGWLWTNVYLDAATEEGKLEVLQLAWNAGCYGLIVKRLTKLADTTSSSSNRRRWTRTIRKLRELAESWEDAADSWLEEEAVSEADRIMKDNDE